jgi:hypothetical protein
MAAAISQAPNVARNQLLGNGRERRGLAKGSPSPRQGPTERRKRAATPGLYEAPAIGATTLADPCPRKPSLTF